MAPFPRRVAGAASEASDDESDSSSGGSGNSDSSSSSSPSSSSSRSPSRSNASKSRSDDEVVADHSISSRAAAAAGVDASESADTRQADDQGAVKSRKRGRVRGGQRNANNDEGGSDEYRGKGGDNATFTSSSPSPSPRKRQLQLLKQQSKEKSNVELSAQYWSEQSTGPSGNGTVYEAMHVAAITDAIGWAHALGGGGRAHLNGGTSEIPLSMYTPYQPPPFQYAHSAAVPSRPEPPPPPSMLGFLLKCANDKMSQSVAAAAPAGCPVRAEHAAAANSRHGGERGPKVDAHQRMNCMFDSSALVGVGVAVEEVLAAAMLPLAAAHVNRCRKMEQQTRRKRGRDEQAADGIEDVGLAQSSSSGRKGGKSDKDDKSSSSTQNEEETCMDINDSPSMSRKAFDTWTMSPAESILNLSKERESKESGSDDGVTGDDAAHTSTHACTRARIQPYLPSAVPPGRYPLSASAGQEIQDVGAYEQFAEQWCRKQGLSSEFVRSRMDDIFGSLLPHTPPQARDRPPEL